MLRKRLAILAVLVALGLGGTAAYAQTGAPPVPQAGTPGGQPPQQGQPPPGGLRPDGSPNRGRQQQPPAGLTAEMLNAPYRGPSTQLPPGVNIPVPRNQDEARQITEQFRPQLQQAADAARARSDIAARFTQRVRSGDRSMPTGAEQSLGSSYTPNQQRAVPPRRSETPIEQGMRLLGLGDIVAKPESEPPASPSDEASLQSVQGACAVYPIGWVERFGYDDWLGAEALNTCGYGISTGQLALYRIDRLETNMHAYRCGWYFTQFDLCLTPQYWASYYPYCELYGAHAYQWCGPEYWEPEYYGAGYFIRAWGNVTTIEGLFGTNANDSRNVAYHCPPEYPFHWSMSCS